MVLVTPPSVTRTCGGASRGADGRGRRGGLSGAQRHPRHAASSADRARECKSEDGVAWLPPASGAVRWCVWGTSESRVLAAGVREAAQMSPGSQITSPVYRAAPSNLQSSNSAWGVQACMVQ